MNVIWLSIIALSAFLFLVVAILVINDDEFIDHTEYVEYTDYTNHSEYNDHGENQIVENMVATDSEYSTCNVGCVIACSNKDHVLNRECHKYCTKQCWNY